MWSKLVMIHCCTLFAAIHHYFSSSFFGSFCSCCSFPSSFGSFVLFSSCVDSSFPLVSLSWFSFSDFSHFFLIFACKTFCFFFFRFSAFFAVISSSSFRLSSCLSWNALASRSFIVSIMSKSAHIRI